MDFPKKVILFLFLLFVGSDISSQNDVEEHPDVEKVRVFLKQHNFKQALAITNRNLKISEKKKDLKIHSWFLSTKGLAYLDTLDSDSGLVFFEQGLAEAYKINYKKSICNNLYGLGKYYYRTNAYISSLKYFQLLNYYSFNDEDKNYQLISHYYLSANYNLLNKPKLSITYARRAANVAFAIADTSTYIKSLLSIATQYFILNNIDSTDLYCIKANAIYQKFSIKNQGIGADINTSFLRTQIIKKNYEKGISYGQLAISDCLDNNDLASLNVIYDNIGLCFLSIKNYDSATVYYEKALGMALQYNYVDEYKEDLKYLVDIYNAKGDSKKANIYVKKYFAADSLYKTESNRNAVDSLKKAFEFEKSQMTLKGDQEKLEQIYKKKQLLYLSVGIILLLLFTGIPYAIYLRKLLRREKEKQNLLLQVKDSEIKALQSQMNPHFIFNSLNSVLEFISRSEKQEAIKYLTKFSRLIRLVLEFSNRKTILLSEELELLDLYVGLENIRSEKGFIFKLNVEQGLDTKAYEIHSMLLQPFIENSIIHGIQNKVKISEHEKKNYEGELILTICKEGEFLKCIVYDNGVGREKAQEIINSKSFNHLSLGMRITKDRLNLISRSLFKIVYSDLKDENNRPCGTRVEILIPLIESF